MLSTRVRPDAPQCDCSPVRVYSLVAFTKFSDLCIHHHSQHFIRIFSLLQKETSQPLVVTPKFPHPLQPSSALE